MCAADPGWAPHIARQRAAVQVDHLAVASLSPDGQRIVSVGNNVEIWNAVDGSRIGEPLTTFQGSTESQFFDDPKAAFSADGAILAVCNRGVLSRLESGGGKAPRVRETRALQGDVIDIAVSENGKSVLVAGASPE